MPMLHGRSLSSAALVLAALLWTAPASADQTIGATCSGSGAGSAMASYWGNNSWCNGSNYVYPFYVMGSAAAAAQSSCSSYTAGAMRWNTTLTNLEVCDGTTWQLVGVGTSTCGSVSGLSFTNVTSASLGTQYTSNTATITFSGCSGALSVSVTGAATAQISVNGGTWSTSGAITSGQTLQVRLTSSGSVSTELTATVTVGTTSANWNVTTRSGSLNIFISKNPYYPSAIGGLSGADAICQAEAGAAGYAGTYMAVMSSDTVSAASRLTLSYPIVNAYNGSTVAATNLWGGSLSNFILTPPGGTQASPEITGSTGIGGISTGDTCTSWSSGGGYTAGNDQSSTASSGWIDWASGYNCSTQEGYIYCIQQ
jgi:hypothetical protein